MKRKSSALPIAMVLALILAGGMVVILQKSFAPGNLYPPYSTLRTDPLGASALVESLQMIPGQEASRNYQTLPKLVRHTGATFVELGGNIDDLIMQSPEDYALLEEAIAAGSRLVILTAPMVDNLPTPLKKKETPSQTDDPEKNAPPQKTAPPAPSEKQAEKKIHLPLNLISLCEKWGFALEILPQPETPSPRPDQVPAENAFPTAQSGLVKPLHWSSHLTFRNLDPSWQVLLEKKGKPVLIERSWGKGSIILGSDAYFVSNEALRSDRRTELVLRVLGPGKNIIFSETQHGLYENTGMADLLRRYHLQGTIACMLLLALLFVWRSVLSLIPPGDEPNPVGPVSLGPTARDGMVHLLQRNLSPLQAFQEGLDRWFKSSGKTSSEAAHLKAHDYLFELRSDKNFGARDIPKIYKTLQTMMTERKRNEHGS